jgi:hypothetical protein
VKLNGQLRTDSQSHFTDSSCGHLFREFLLHLIFCSKPNALTGLAEQLFRFRNERNLQRKVRLPYCKFK